MMSAMFFYLFGLGVGVLRRDGTATVSSADMPRDER